jgi:hypothetical protein
MPVTFQLVSQKVFVPLCVKCHGSGMRLANIRLDKYSEAIKSADELRKSTLKASMPPSGRRITKEEGDLILEWLDQGMPQ